jgi:hypothetical protein
MRVKPDSTTTAYSAVACLHEALARNVASLDSVDFLERDRRFAPLKRAPE